MRQNRFKNLLVKIKEQFFQKITPFKSTLSSEEVSLLLYKYTQQQPLILNDFLVKGTGKLQISWEDLLAYFQEEINIKDEVKKIEINPLSATQIVECYQNAFQKLVHHIKQKETNSIQSINSVPVQIAGRDIFLVCLDKELMFYDYRNAQIIGNMVFRYSKVKQKLFLRQEEKRLKKEIQSQKKEAQYLDKVQILNINPDKKDKRKEDLQRLLSSNLKESIRGSELSSQKSNDRKLFRKMQTDYGMARRKEKSNILKIKNDDVKRVFDIFCQASVQNSIKVANIFKESRQNFKKYVELDKSLVQAEKKEVNFDYSSLALHRNFRKQLTEMRSTNLKLTKMRKSIDSGQSRSKSLMDFCPGDQNLFSKTKKVDPLQKSINILEIVTYHIFQNYLLVSLFNREVRLITLKKAITNFESTTVFQKSFKEIVTYVEMYQGKKKGEFKIVLALEINSKNSTQNKNTSQLDRKSTNILVYHLDKDKNINHKSFDEIFDFSARCEPIKTFGLALFNQKGHFSLLQLNCLYQQIQERVDFDLVLNNPTNNYKICISILRHHKNLINLYLACAAGYVYLFDRLCQRIKYHNRINAAAILDMQLIKDDAQILVLYSNGKIAILSANHLQKYFVYQSYHDIFDESKLLIYDHHKFYLYTARDVSGFEIVLNQQKKFNNFKPIKILNNRDKIKNRSTQKSKKQKQKVIKVIQGKGGKGDFVAILYENGQICLLDNEFQYIGSYFYFNISNISDLICNQQYQFIAFLTEDNTIQVVNLYTQTVLFNLNFLTKENQREKQVRSKTESLKSSAMQRTRQKKTKNTQAVKCMQFMDSSTSGMFFAVIKQSNIVSHYSEKGQIISTVNIQKSCNEEVRTEQLFYQKDQLLFLTNGAITLLRRKSYVKKIVIPVCENRLFKIKKSQEKNSSKLLCLDQQCNLYQVDLTYKTVNKLYNGTSRTANQQILFNQHYILLPEESSINLIKIGSEQELSLKSSSQIFIYRLAQNRVIRINKLSGKISKLNLAKQQFQQMLI